MKQVVVTLSIFVIGVIVGYVVPSADMVARSLPVLILIIIFLAGIEIGSDRSHLAQFKNHSLRILLLPLLVGIGSLVGGVVSAVILPSTTLYQAILVSSGLGYYSLSGSMISSQYSIYWGTVALLSDIMRETVTLLLAPILMKYLGGVAIIASAAATSMDNCLPIIRKTAGVEWVYPAFVSGLVLTLVVPLLLSFLLRL